MSEIFSEEDLYELHEWRHKVKVANHNNIFCHCRTCGAEWVDSSFEAICGCGSLDVERISCWQFPDD